MKTKTLLTIAFIITVLIASYLQFTESTYSLKHLAADLQSTMILMGLLFYKEETK